MKDVEILAKYLQRRFKGRIETFSGIVFNNNAAITNSNLRIYHRRNTVEFWVDDGDVTIQNYRPACSIKMHMAYPDFETKLYVFLTDKAGVKPSRLKAEY